MSDSIMNVSGFTTPLRPKVILLNGPPQCGKDTVGNMIAEMRMNAVLRKFAQPITDVMQTMFGVTCSDGFPKGDPCDELGGKTRREVAISFSEDWIKPNFDDRLFGRILLRKIAEHDHGQCAVVTDSGFWPEADVLLKHFNPGEVELVKISRPGCTFEGDSRNYWSDERVVRRQILNDGSLEDLQAQVKAMIDNHWTR